MVVNQGTVLFVSSSLIHKLSKRLVSSGGDALCSTAPPKWAKTSSHWEPTLQYAHNRKDFRSIISLTCSLRTLLYRGKYTYFSKCVPTSLKSFWYPINLKNKSTRSKLVINDLLVDITNLWIFLQVEIQVHMAKNTIFH